MKTGASRLSHAVFIVASAALVSACAELEPTVAGCSAVELGGACVGVPAEPLCSGDVCTADANCTETLEARSDAELQSRIAAAAPRTCIALAPGDYGEAELPGGVSLLGRGASSVRVYGVSVRAGSGAVVRGLSIGDGGLRLDDGAAGVQLAQVRIAGAGDGLRLGRGASATVKKSEIAATAGLAIRAFDIGGLTVEESILGPSGGPGLWAQCATGCDCGSRPDVALTKVLVRENGTAGVALVGAAATLAEVTITDPHSGGSNDVPGGLVAFGCSAVTASTLRVTDTDPSYESSYGVLVDGSSATLGGDDDEHGVDLLGNFVGLWVQNLSAAGDQPVTIQRCRVEESRGVGIGLSGATTKGIIINWTQIRNTRLESMTVSGGSPDTVGDGLVWRDGAQAAITNLTLGGNERGSMLIDGNVGEGSSLAEVTQTEGDEAKGIVQQNFGGISPAVSGSVPALDRVTTQLYTVPEQQDVPAATP